MHSSKSVRPNIWDDRALKTLERVKRSYRRFARRQEAGGDARVAQVRKLFGKSVYFCHEGIRNHRRSPRWLCRMQLLAG
jgi:hypothetical protein